MNQGENINWSSGLGTQKINGNLGNSDKGSEKVMDDQGVALTFNLPKRLDDSQGEVLSNDLPNGHNNSENVDGIPRTKSIGELLQDSEQLEDTVLVSPGKDNSEEAPSSEVDKADEQSSCDKENDKSIDESNSDGKELENDSKNGEKSSKIEESQDMFETSNEGSKSANDSESKEEKPKDKLVEESQGFKLEVSESQFFKDADADADSSQDSSKEEPEENEKEEVEEATKDDDEEMKDEPEVQTKSPSSPGQSVKTDESTEPSERPSVQSVPTVDYLRQATLDLGGTPPPAPHPSHHDPSRASVRSLIKRFNEKVDNPESMQSIRTTPSVAEPCTCDPSCHSRVHSISERLSSACKQLGDFIKLKRRVENPELTNLLSVLTSIESIAENKPQAMSSPLPDQAFYAEAGSSKKKSNARARYETATPQKEPAEKKPRKMDTPKIVLPEEKVNFQSIQGLAVFAKWPNSGWYYPGVIRGLSPSGWKEATNVTVTFYDGLVREMKNINILPANLIPPGVILCDLDDETEMLVNSSKSIEDNNVEFKLALKDDPKTIVDSGFNKLAIRAAHMKSIKTVLEPSVDVVPKKMHMVSLDNLVSGRRSRVRTSKEDGDELVMETPRKGTRKSVRKAAETPMEDEDVDEEDPTLATPSRKRSSSIDQSSTHKRSAKRGKQ